MSSSIIPSSPSQGAQVPCLEVLRKTPLFAGLSDAQLKVVAPPCRRLPTCSGRLFFSKGDEAREVYVVLNGEVYLEEELVLGDNLPPRTILVETVGKNGVFGLCALIQSRRAMLTARCAQDAEIIAIDSQDLMALLQTHATVGVTVMANAFRIAFGRLVCLHDRIIADLGLPMLYETYRNY
jgi:CRP-like cAMP-binding protein